MQTMLRRIAKDYPAIPIVQADGIFGGDTQQAVETFQEIFGLTPDGVVGTGTWYKMVYLYVGITELAELVSEGQTFYGVEFRDAAAELLRPGNEGNRVRVLQYMLDVLAEFYPDLPPIAVDGIYGPATRAAVEAFQRQSGLTESGAVDPDTWAALYRDYAGIRDTVIVNDILLPLVELPSQA